jgi:hypothetical protein
LQQEDIDIAHLIYFRQNYTIFAIFYKASSRFLYPSELKIWPPGSVKALGIVDRKVVHISNIDHFTIGDSQELSRSLAAKF